jgi:hypothetical protein
MSINDEIRCLACIKVVGYRGQKNTEVYPVTEGALTKIFCKKCGVKYEQRQANLKYIFAKIRELSDEALENLRTEIDYAFFMRRGYSVYIPLEKE